jgi:hypothetical protein
MSRSDDQGPLWINITAVIAVACTIGALYLPLVLR